jgi:RNA polymerase sigma-70 factor, ECF subfamily
MREQALRAMTPPDEKADDADLIDAARHDPAIFARLYRRHVDAVYRYCFSRSGNRADAEDLTAKVFLEAWQGLERYRHRGTFRAWLFTIVHRRVIDFYRHTARDPVAQALPIDASRDGAVTGGPYHEVVLDEALRKLGDLVAGLDHERQTMLTLRYAGDLTYREIGQVMGKTTAAVKMTVRRTLKRLADQWRENDE